MIALPPSPLAFGNLIGQGVGFELLAAGPHPLAHLNAALNALATVLLLVGLWLIKARREQAHGRVMIAALAVSAAFLVSYLIYHYMVGSVRFTHEGLPRLLYLIVLGTHIPLAFTVPFLSLRAAYLGTRALGWGSAAALPIDERARIRVKHVRSVRWAYPIWLYVSVTGVAVYVMLYHIWPSAEL